MSGKKDPVRPYSKDGGTMGSDGAAYADQEGNWGVYPAMKVDVVDTTGAGDAFFAGVCVGLTYGKINERGMCHWYPSFLNCNLYLREHLSEIYAGRI